MGQGQCLCGASTFSYEGAPKFAFRCYCTDCQKASGGSHMPQMGIEAGKLTVSGPVKVFSKPSDSGNTLSFSFCGECGAPLFKATSMMEDTVFVNAGAVQPPLDVDFSKRVFEGSKPGWETF